MSEPSHPPIPPNCEFFEEYNKEIGYRFCWPDFTFLRQSIKNAKWRKIIAAVARCAWLDIQEKAEEDHYNAITNRDKTQDEVKQYTALIEEAYKNAEAWREWGEKK